VIRANITLDRDDEVTSHYVAFCLQDNQPVSCFHQHKTVSEAAACIQGPGGGVRAITDGRIRPLTYEEQGLLIKALSALYFSERKLSHADDKTGLLNERGFRQVLNQEMARSRRTLRPMTLVYIDLDGFKAVNDEKGHRIGDQVLRVVAETMARGVREVDFVARLHGDEFALLFPEANVGNARLIVGKLKTILGDTMKGYQWNITFSIGVVTFKTPPRAPDYMIDEADKVMYMVKRSGKDRVSSLVLD